MMILDYRALTVGTENPTRIYYFLLYQLCMANLLDHNINAEFNCVFQIREKYKQASKQLSRWYEYIERTSNHAKLQQAKKERDPI